MTARRGRVLVAEDERDLGDTLRENLELEGYDADLTTDGETALSWARAEAYELLILDVMLPRLDGFAICERLRQDGHATPILFLTALQTPENRIRGLRSGGDDYLGKPFDLRELLLRVAALIRRKRSATPEPQVRFGDNLYDLATRRAVDAVRGVHRLMGHEARVLEMFLERPDQELDRTQILAEAWGDDVRPSTRTVDRIVGSLRARFEIDPASPRHFVTVSPTRYRFVRDPQEDLGE